MSKEARGSVVIKALCYRPEGRGFDTRWGEFWNLNLQAALGPGVYSVSNRNEYQNIKIIMFLESKLRRLRKADNLTAIYEPIV
jgi:hypothetical protein